MAKSALDKIKDTLIQEKDRLDKELGALAQKGKRGFRFVMSSLGSKDEEHTASVANFDNTISVGNNLEKGLHEVEKALAKIEKGDYGVCELCRQPIEAGRLKAAPSATSCVNCQEEKMKLPQ